MSNENSEAEDEDDVLDPPLGLFVNVLQDLLAVHQNEDSSEESDEEIEMEEEGIEIVNASDSGEEEDDEGEGNVTPFDATLPSSHSYMGDDMEDLHGRTVHVDGDLILLPLFYRPGLVLMPGQILPLNLFHPQLISMMQKVIAADKTFGLMFAKSQSHGVHGDAMASVGVTCEIFSVKEEENYGVTQMSIKAEGRQRFKILSKKAQMDGVIMGKIKILPDAYIPPYPSSGQIFSQPHLPNSIRSQIVANSCYVDAHPWKQGESRYLAGFNKQKAHVLCSSLSSVQGWIYKLYNPYFLMDCLLNEIHSWNENLKFENLPTNPIEFSHWITANLPLTNEMKIELLEIDSASLRMRRQIDIMNKCATTLACVECEAVIADKNHLFSLSRKGPVAAYVNPGGYVHETVTFYKAKNLSLTGRASTQYSWFPGYAWTVASCKDCHRHMGWKFTAAKKGLNPSKFWGLSRASLRPVYKQIKEEPPEEVKEKVDELNDSVASPMDEQINPVQYESNI